ncbi:uncharacterized protein F5147DRAFT_769565 [Suillus discolor]|uniref:Uncharacterized protein n=1 Tax=Suillus discolor TaxID=1912936 RepID=A0A9P7FEB6_9AGAM|nr:uncharacterized protein F5147DRAFT_769565 [Suillus discolor]KAG2115105.1 hypothetical protein F5147DRAFT_769565 [Suillus discolor]
MKDGFLRHFVAWIIDDDLPWTTGETPGIQKSSPSFVKELTVVKSKISYSTDNWKTKQMVFTFAGTIASFINDDWELCEHLIDFHHIKDKEHKGIHAAKAFIQTAVIHGGLKKIICLNNASSCDTFTHATGKLLQDHYSIQFHEGNAQIQCIAYVVNLIIQAMLASLDKAKNHEEDYFVLNKHLPFHYDPNNDSGLQEFKQETNRDGGDKDSDANGILELEDPELDDEAKKLLNVFAGLSPVKKMSTDQSN